MSDIIRSVLFVDFDNVFFSLQSADKAAAKSFANDPRRWLDAIESGSLIESVAGTPAVGRRRILMRRCYANPAVMRYFRSYFTRSGFQIVDCPPLTGRGKNSADIYMVVDMLDALRHETRFDEFIILSGDADFTPVLLRLRAYDRSSVIYSNAVTATAYKSLCDAMITEERLIDLTGDGEESEEEGVAPAQSVPSAPTASPPTPVFAELAGPPERRIERTPGERSAPERPAERVRNFDRRRSAPRVPPETAEAAIGDLPAKPIRIAPELAGLARRVNAATNVPMFSSEVYAALFRMLAGEVRDSGFSFNRTVNAVIRRLGEAGLRLRPQHVAFVVKGLMLSGHEFVADDTPAALAKGFRRQVLYLCANEDLTLTDTERGQVGLWIVGGLRNLTESEILTSEPVTSDASRAAELAGVDPDADQMASLDIDHEETDEARGEARPDDPADEEPGDDESIDESVDEESGEDEVAEDEEGYEGEADEADSNGSVSSEPGAEQSEAPSGLDNERAAELGPEKGGKPRANIEDLLARMRSPPRG